MNTSEIYSQILLENIIKDYLERGEVPTLAQIEADFNVASAGQDLTSSNFTSQEWKVNYKETSSARKFNRMNHEIEQDINVLYKSLYLNSERTVELFTRWQKKASALENRLKDLEARIGRLLVLSADSSGYFETVGDRFTDTTLIDLDRSSNIFVNLQQNLITLDRTNRFKSDKPDRIFFNDITNTQVVFTPVTRTNIIGVNNIDNTQPYYALLDQDLYWKTHLLASTNLSPVIGELLVTLNDPIALSRIEIILHSSQNNSVTQITPLFSTDGVNFERVPAINTIAEGVDKVIFQFPQIETSVIKFILEKRSYDFIENGLFVFEFGAKEIAIFNDSFSNDSDFIGTLISKPLSVVNPDKTLVRFNKLTLDACEGISQDSHIDYYIAVAKDSNGSPNWLVASGLSTSIDDSNGEDQRLWHPITPSKRTNIDHPQVIDLATLSKYQRNNIGISFDATATTLVSPAATYTLLEPSGEIFTYVDYTATAQRYIFHKSTHRLLDLQINQDTEIDLKSLTLWRNVGERGIVQGDTTKLVRGTQIGWEFSAPYYLTTVLIDSNNGFAMNVGKNPIVIDGVTHTGVIGPDVLTPGIHTVKIHQDFWNAVEPGLNSLSDLKSKDILYPYNQKLLIEGYEYGTSYPSNEEQLYIGVDRFAGFVMKQVSIFDLINNVPEDDLSKFALDIDIQDTSPVDSSRVFVINCDPTIADFVNEQFMLEFNLTDQLFSYLALKAEFSTENSQLTPILDEYKIKLGF